MTATLDRWAVTARTFYASRAPEQAQPVTYRRFAHAYRRLIRRLDIRAGMTVLDAGCGVGPLAAGLAGSGAQVIGIDISPESLKIAANRAAAGHYAEADMTALPFADQRFDRVVSISSLEFCADKHKALCEVRRVLKPGGRLYAEVVNADFLLLRLPPGLTRALRGASLLQAYDAEGFANLGEQCWRRLLAECGWWQVQAHRALRPWNYGPAVTRAKNLMIHGVRNLAPLRCHYMIGFTCTRPA